MTDNINQLPNGGIKQKIDALPKGYDSDLCHAWTPMNDHQCQSDGLRLNDLKALVSELETKTRALEEISEVDSTEPKAIKYAKAIRALHREKREIQERIDNAPTESAIIERFVEEVAKKLDAEGWHGAASVMRELRARQSKGEK